MDNNSSIKSVDRCDPDAWSTSISIIRLAAMSAICICAAWNGWRERIKLGSRQRWAVRHSDNTGAPCMSMIQLVMRRFHRNQERTDQTPRDTGGLFARRWKCEHHQSNLGGVQRQNCRERKSLSKEGFDTF